MACDAEVRPDPLTAAVAAAVAPRPFAAPFRPAGASSSYALVLEGELTSQYDSGVNAGGLKDRMPAARGKHSHESTRLIPNAACPAPTAALLRCVHCTYNWYLCREAACSHVRPSSPRRSMPTAA